MQKTKLILPIIVISQFLGTSLWFAGNAVLADLVINFNLDATALQSITSAVQFGFITGTLLFALFTIADRFSPSKVFFICAILGAAFNAALVLEGNTLTSILGLRFLTGLFLAGIYPVGMKIATDYYQKGLGKSLGYLVGALVLGTAFPHLLKNQLQAFPWERIILFISLLASLGGLLLYLFVPNGPFRKKSTGLQLNNCVSVFKNTAFRKAAYGYFGHMWELYTFWAFVPILLKTYASLHPNTNFNIPLLSFFCIAVGSLVCVLGSQIAETFGAKKTAMSSLFLSCCCCLLSPLFFLLGSETVFVVLLLFWGMVVIADSPLFSQLVAENAPQQDKGTALTIVNCIGFSLTILSIQLLSYFYETANTNLVFMLLAIGPALGLLALRKKKNTKVFSEARE